MALGASNTRWQRSHNSKCWLPSRRVPSKISHSRMRLGILAPSTSIGTVVPTVIQEQLAVHSPDLGHLGAQYHPVFLESRRVLERAACHRDAALACVQGFERLFLAPGVEHCGGGPGPDRFEALEAVEKWVAQSIAPDRIVASHSSNGVVDRTRPLCPFSQVARYLGTGATHDPTNFICRASRSP